MKKELTILSVLLSFFATIAQNPTTSIASWKNNAEGAYSFIHDDYGDNGVIGINNYADTIARNRGIKFTIGAITSACEANPAMWTQAIDMISYGHEIINHSHNHHCAVKADAWCTTGLWAEPATENFATEMTQSNNSIITNTGTTPRYFIYPYDLYNDAANTHLKSLNYIGSRTGSRAENPVNFAPDVDGFFKTSFYVKTEDNGGDVTAVDLNYWADQASTTNSWINREMHNVGSTGWGRISVTDYRNHLDHLKTRIDANKLWVGTISEVLTYQIQKINYTATTTYNVSTKEITVLWNTPSFDVLNYLQPLTKKSPVTLLINLDGIDATGMIATQGGNTISGVTVSSGVMKFDAYPHEGTIKISGNGCTDFCLVSGLSNQSININDNSSFSINITGTPTVTYAWYLNDVLLIGETSSTLSLTNAQVNQAGTYKVIASKTGEADITSTATLTVSNQTPYNNTIATIPGIVEFEHFDVGGQGVSYNESSSWNEGGASLRSEPVDLEIKGTGHKLGYTIAGEWLEYTVDITANAIYDLEVNNASLTAGGGFTLSIDGIDVSPNLTFTPTGGWTTWTITKFSNISLSKGQHILRVTMTANDHDFDYMEFKINTLTSIVASGNEKTVIYPNPTNNSFHLKTSVNDLTNILVFNVNGQVVQDLGSYNGSNLSFGSQLSPGIYFIQFKVDGVIQREKIIKN